MLTFVGNLLGDPVDSQERTSEDKKDENKYCKLHIKP